MTIERLKRIMIRLRQESPGQEVFCAWRFKKPVIHECGVHEITFKRNMKALHDIGWIKKHKRKWKLTGLDLTEEINLNIGTKDKHGETLFIQQENLQKQNSNSFSSLGVGDTVNKMGQGTRPDVGSFGSNRFRNWVKDEDDQ